MIRALVFDFDGLIIDTETPIIEAWASLHQEAGLPHNRDEALKIVGHVDIAFDPWMAFAKDVDRAELDREHKRRSRAILSSQSILPGILDTFEAAKRRGIGLGIASNSPHVWVDTHLKRLGLFEYFSAIKCRDDVARGKPEPEVYQAALAGLGAEPSEAIAFEDSAPGSLAAKRAGMWCVAIPNLSTLHHDFSHVDVKLTSLAETTLEHLLQKWG